MRFFTGLGVISGAYIRKYPSIILTEVEAVVAQPEGIGICLTMIMIISIGLTQLRKGWGCGGVVELPHHTPTLPRSVQLPIN
jgi:hypothetical protein